MPPGGKDPSLSRRYYRLLVRRGKKKAAIALGRTILELCYQLLSTGKLCDPHQARATPVTITAEQRLVRRLEQLGHRVTLVPAA